MRTLVLQALAVIVGVAVLSAEVRSTVKLNGELIYSSGGNSLHSLSLETRRLRRVYESVNRVAFIENVSAWTQHAVVFDECSLTGPCVLRVLSLDTLQHTTLRAGRLPAYSRHGDLLFFYDNDERGVLKLFVAESAHLQRALEIAPWPGKHVLPNGLAIDLARPVIPLQDDRALFVGNQGRLRLYDTKRKQVSDTQVRDCLPQAWRSSTETVLCATWDWRAVYETTLDGRKTIEWPALRNSSGFIYLAEHDAVLLGSSRWVPGRGEVRRMSFFPFATAEISEIRDDTNLRSGVVLAGNRGREY